MKFEDLIVWQKARELTNEIYRLGRETGLKADFSLRDQLQRAAASSMANLAEGFERIHKTEKLQFWNVAKASSGEVRCLFYVVGDNQLAAPERVKKLQLLAAEVGALTGGLIKSFRAS